jgi:predicted XRE-type DNA-binding protein
MAYDPNSTTQSSSEDIEFTESSGNVFEDLGFDRDEAENLKLRARLMISLRRFIDEQGMTQSEAADVFGVTQPRISDLVNKKIEKFSIDTLVNMHATAGMKVRLTIEPEADDAQLA